MTSSPHVGENMPPMAPNPPIFDAPLFGEHQTQTGNVFPKVVACFDEGRREGFKKAVSEGIYI